VTAPPRTARVLRSPRGPKRSRGAAARSGVGSLTREKAYGRELDDLKASN
jgi:hypothetical protein